MFHPFADLPSRVVYGPTALPVFCSAHIRFGLRRGIAGEAHQAHDPADLVLGGKLHPFTARPSELIIWRKLSSPPALRTLTCAGLIGDQLHMDQRCPSPGVREVGAPYRGLPTARVRIGSKHLDDAGPTTCQFEMVPPDGIEPPA